jgi:hypothetical protein
MTKIAWEPTSTRLENGKKIARIKVKYPLSQQKIPRIFRWLAEGLE